LRSQNFARYSHAQPDFPYVVGTRRFDVFRDRESIKVGGAKTASGVVGYIAIEKGYFAAEGLDAQLVFFDSA
jgi:ABC-type nitrate/sulfonate/bicarbonate transport system substrate-binding protein